MPDCLNNIDNSYYPLKGRTAVITGGTRGIGKAIALKLASKGADIVINYKNNSKAAEDVVGMIEKIGSKAIAVQCDVGIYDEALKLIKETVNSFKSIDILVNNAGITRDGLLLRMKEKDFDDVINTNLKGTYNCLKHACSYMLRQRRGRIINISSVVGIIGNSGQINYAAAKAGIIGITKSAAKEFASRGITVNAIAPGFIATDMTNALSDSMKEEIIKNIPLKRPGNPEDVASAVAFLASDEASYITGQIINVDGGMVM